MMTMYHSNLIKSKLSIKNVIETYTGEKFTNSRIRCPFHNEKTASFFVNDKKQYFKCFGCNIGGDVIKFVQLYFNIDFKDAISKLGSDFGIEGGEVSPAELIHIKEEARKRKAFEKWERETFMLLCRAYHAGKEYINEHRKGFFFERLTDDYLYIINHIDLVWYYSELICENPIEFYKNYGKGAADIARGIITRCGELGNKYDDLRQTAI